MALQFNYTDPGEGVHSAAYAKVTVVTLRCGADSAGAQECSALVQLGIWHAASSRNASPPKPTVQMVVFSVSGADYNTYFSFAALDIVSSNPTKKAYQYLKAHVPAGTEPDLRTATDV